MIKARYSDEEFAAAVANSRTIANVLRTLGLTLRSGNYRTVHNKVQKLMLDISHWDPVGVTK